MLKKISLTAMAVCFLAPSLALSETALDSLSTAFGTGTVSGQIGDNFRTVEAKDDSADGTIGFGFFELGYETNEFHGAKLGAYFIGVGEIWAKKANEFSFDDGGEFQDKAMLREFYVHYTLPGSKTELLAGRKLFDGTPVTDGHSHQGVQVTVGDIDNITITTAVMNRWVDNADTSYGLDGINSTWLDGDDVLAGASDTVFSLMVDAALVPDMISVTPFVVHQSDIITTYGASAAFTSTVADSLTADLEGVFAVYDEDTESSGDEDACSYNLHGSISSEKWSAGVGYYVMSDDARVGEAALGNDTFDPMEEGPHSALQDDNTFYIDAEYSFGPATVAFVYGDTNVDNTNEGANEFDLYLTYAITEKITSELMFVDVNDDDSSADYQVYAGTINLSF